MSSKVTFDVLARSKATGFDETNRKIAQQAAVAEKASKDTKLLSSALLAAGSAAIPLGAAGVAAVAGLGAAAGTAALAGLGLVKAWKAGTLQTTALGKQVIVLQGNIRKLETTAAQGVAPGFTAGLKSINKLMPAVNNDVKTLSGQLGQIGGNTGAAAVGLFHTLSPLVQDFGSQLVKGSAAFKQWATNSSSLRTFVGYAQNQLPLAEQTLANVGVSAAHVVTALAPFGSTTVRAINTFSGAIRAIPVGALEAVVPLLAGGFIGKKVGSALGSTGAASGISSLIGKLQGASKEGGTASKVLGATGKIVGNLGAVGVAAGLALGGLSAIMGIGERNAAKYRAQVDKVTQSLQNGTAAQAAWVAAQNTGADAAKKLGLTQQQIVAQVEQGQKATGAYANAITDLKNKRVGLEQQYLRDIHTFGQGAKATQDDEKALRDNASAIDVLVNKASTAGAQFAAAKKELAGWATQQGDTALATEISSGKFVGLAKSLGVTTSAYVSAKAAADAATLSLQAQTAQMILTNDAAGLLAQSLDRLGNQNASVLAAQTGLATANNSVAASFKSNKAAIDGSSAAALANQQALQGQHDAAVALATALGKQTGSTKQEVQSLKDSKAALEATLASQHRLTPEVQAYINKLYNLKNLKLPPTKIDVDKANADAKVAAFKKSLIQIPGYRPSATVNANTNQALAKLKDIKDYLSSINGTTAYTYVQTVLLGQKTADNKRAAGSARASGGRVLAGRVYTVNEQGQELYVRDNSQAYLIRGGRQQWRAPANGQIINAATVRSLLGKTVNALHVAVTKLPTTVGAAVSAVAKVLPSGSAVTRRLETEDNQLNKLAKSRATVASKLAAANQKLVDAEKAMSDKAAAVRDTLLGGFNITQFGQTSSQFGGVQAILDSAKSAATQMAAFRKQITKLQQLGLNKTDLDALIQAGPSAQAAALANASKSQIAQLNLSRGQFGFAASKIADLDAKSLYQAGVNAAKGLVKGLASQQAALNKQIASLAASMVKGIKKALGIRSPSRVMMPIGRNTVLGFVKGIDASTAHVVAAASRMGNAAVPAPSTYSSGNAMTGWRGENHIHVHIEAGTLVHQQDVGRYIRGVLEREFAQGHTVAGGQKAMR